MRYKFFIIIISFILCSSCQSEVETSLERLGLHYFPMKVGQYKIYNVEETTYFLLGPERRQYQLKESIVSDSLLSSNDLQYTVHREIRSDSLSNWILDSIWSANVSSQRAVLTENNISFIKMVFPIHNELTWDANAFNIRSEEIYRYTDALKDTTLNGIDYTELWTVIQSENEQNFLGRDERYEIYGPDVGLVLKSSIIWSFCQSDCSSENQIVAGRELLQSLIEYGEE